MRFLEALQQRIIVFDGAMGTTVQRLGLTADDFGGKALEGCNEHLVLTRPGAIEAIHRRYFEVGADVTETNSFGASRIVLAEYGIEAQARAINRRSAELARRAADAFSTPERPRFVAGDIGPGTKLPTLGHIGFQELVDAFREQAMGLIEGGADILLIITCQDILQVKAGIIAAQEAKAACGSDAAIMVSMTIEQTGTMLLGTEIGGALAAIEPYGIDVFGMNCATGPKEMEENVRYLSQHAPMAIAVIPNAGLPENIGGHAHYRLTPEEFVTWQTYFVEHYRVNIVGGCCGTTDAHIGALATAMHGRRPVRRAIEWIPAITSLYAAVPLDQEPKPLLVGERTNANGSKLFREHLQNNNWDGLVHMGREQAAEGSHALDVCVAYVGRDELSDMEETIRRFVTQVPLPLVIDSTEPPVIERALQLAGGKCLVNSINMEDGRERIERIMPLVKRYGAAVVALTIDETGMAKTADRKAAIARRIFEICTREYGLKPENLLFDTLTFTLGSGDAEFHDAGIQTLEGIRRVKAELPGVRTILGVSNISFGLDANARVVLNSVFLHEAVAAGLDAAIVHAAKILPLHKIPEAAQALARRLIFNDRAAGDPLAAFMAYFETNTVAAGTQGFDDSDRPIAARLQRRIVDGNRNNLEDLLAEALKTTPALEIINAILLEGMKEVGELFGAGKMQLPFVLQSAEVMKAAVRYLEPHMERTTGVSKGKIVLATVKGDVHDIGKNLVDIILTNNGYTVYNLGIKVAVERMLAAAEEHRADAIGMSGLLVKSTAIMKENLEEMTHRGIAIPVICGGAALTRGFVERDLRAAYGGAVFYGKDAFEGLKVMEGLVKGDTGHGTRDMGPTATPLLQTKTPDFIIHSSITRTNPIPAPPFWGVRVVRHLPVRKIFPLINKTALFKGQWQFKQGKSSKAEYEALVADTVEPLFQEWQTRCLKMRLVDPQVVYGYLPCQSEGNDVVIYDDPERRGEVLRFTFPRQSQAPFYCIADFFRPIGASDIDVIGMQVVTVGKTAAEEARRYYAEGRYTDYLYLHGLSVEVAEALAEHWHKVIREELGIAHADAPNPEGYFRQGYQGSRYSFGYPACPALEDQAKLFALLRPERIGVTLSETYQMDPEASTSAIIVHHPDAKYFDTK